MRPELQTILLLFISLLTVQTTALHEPCTSVNPKYNNVTIKQEDYWSNIPNDVHETAFVRKRTAERAGAREKQMAERAGAREKTSSANTKWWKSRVMIYLSIIGAYVYNTFRSIQLSTVILILTDAFIIAAFVMAVLFIASTHSKRCERLYKVFLPAFITIFTVEFWYRVTPFLSSSFNYALSTASRMAPLPPEEIVTEAASCGFIGPISRLFNQKIVTGIVKFMAGIDNGNIPNIFIYALLTFFITLFMLKFVFFKSPFIRNLRYQMTFICLFCAIYAYNTNGYIMDFIHDTKSGFLVIPFGIIRLIIRDFQCGITREAMLRIFGPSLLGKLDTFAVVWFYIVALSILTFLYSSAYAAVLMFHSKKEPAKGENVQLITDESRRVTVKTERRNELAILDNPETPRYTVHTIL